MLFSGCSKPLVGIIPKRKEFGTGFSGLVLSLCFGGERGGDSATDRYSSSLKLKTQSESSLGMGYIYVSLG